MMLIRKDKNQFFVYARKWSLRVLKLVGVKVNITGNSDLNLNNIFVFTANHSSMLDIPLLLAHLPGNVAIIYKQELEKIPIFGDSIKKSPYIGINRSNPRASMTSINQAVEVINSGVSVIVFPEGTRSLDGKLIDFKRGAFLLATRSGKPIVPVTVKGSSKLLPPGNFRFNGGEVEIVFSDIIMRECQTPKEEKELMNNVRSIISEELAK